MSQSIMKESPATIQDMLLQWSQVEPHTSAFIFYDAEWNRRTLSRLQVYQLSSRYAAILKREGIKKGDIVCNTLPNSPERLITQYGCTMAGAISLNGQVFLTSGANFMGCLRRTKCKALIVNPNDPIGPLHLLQAQHGKDWLNDLPHEYLPNLCHVMECQWQTKADVKSLMDVLEEATESYVCESDPSDPVHIFTTSGTTGFSKMVMRNHIEMARMCNAARDALGIKAGDVYFNDRPLGWSGGYPMTFPMGGNTRVLTDLSKGQSKEPFKFMWDLICEEKCDVSFIVPYHIEKICQVYDTQESSEWKLKSILSGGQPLKKSHLDAVGKITSSLSVTYGSTEGGTISFKRITHPEQYTDCNNGAVYPGVEVKIVNPDMVEVPEGNQGEILIRSNQTCRSYLGGSESDVYSFLEDGWFSTGDIGFINEQGEISVVCREKFGIIHGSYVIYPGWIEVLLLKCPFVQSVAVVPVPDPSLHHEICACVIAKPNSDINEESLGEFYRSLFLKNEDYEKGAFPKYYLFFSNFPTTSTGKVCRNTLQKEAIQKLGLSE